MNEKMIRRLLDLKAAQVHGEYTLCPRCGRDTMNPELSRNALSRQADIMVCERCGYDEAMQAFMHCPDTVYRWKALQPERLPGDYSMLSGEQAWDVIKQEQIKIILKLFRRFESGEGAEEVRFDAFENCKGLLDIWTEPFQLKYKTRNGALLIQVRKNTTGNELVCYIMNKTKDD